jgi:pSer/pThr/pTyr-binding forkhead associated (FHA) protein
MHSALTQGDMQPVTGSRVRHKTIDLLVLEPDRMPTTPSGSPLEKLYKVSELKPPEGADTILFGRSEECDVQLNDRSVSRQHARIEVSEGRYLITDCDSSAGTFVNGQQIPEGESKELSSGDSVGFGYLSVVFLDPSGFYQSILDIFGN